MISTALVGRTSSVLRITLTNARKRNVLSKAVLTELNGVLTNPPETARAIVIASDGPVFSSGHDLKELLNGDQSERIDIFSLCLEVMMRLRHHSLPTLAQVEGHAFAAGLQLVSACDMAIAADTGVTFATPGVKVGLFCHTPAVELGLNIPRKALNEMLLTGKAIGAERALQIGLINRIASDCASETLALADDIIEGSSREVLESGKTVLAEQLHESDPIKAYEIAACAMVEGLASEHAILGIEKFFKKT